MPCALAARPFPLLLPLPSAAKIVQKRFLADKELDRKLQQQILQAGWQQAQRHEWRRKECSAGGVRTREGCCATLQCSLHSSSPGYLCFHAAQTAIKVVNRRQSAAAAGHGPARHAQSRQDAEADPTRRLEFEQASCVTVCLLRQASMLGRTTYRVDCGSWHSRCDLVLAPGALCMPPSCHGVHPVGCPLCMQGEPAVDAQVQAYVAHIEQVLRGGACLQPLVC